MESVLSFASMTFYGYDRFGGHEKLAEFANGALKHWRRDGSLPTNERDLRGSLFFEARRWHHLGAEPDAEAEHYIRSLLGGIHRVTDGTVQGDQPHWSWWFVRTFRRTQRVP